MCDFSCTKGSLEVSFTSYSFLLYDSNKKTSKMISFFMIYYLL